MCIVLEYTVIFLRSCLMLVSVNKTAMILSEIHMLKHWETSCVKWMIYHGIALVYQ